MTLPATQAHRDVLQTASSEAASLMDVIARASRDTTVDVSKFERLMELYERVEGRKAEEAFNEAMAKTQEEMKPIAKDAQGDKFKFASYAALDKALRPIYTKHDFSLSFNTLSTQRENEVRVVCYVTRGRFTREYGIDMPADGKGARGGEVMDRTKATGSAVTYGMRYLLKMIFNVAVEQDDDGKAAGHRPTPPRKPERPRLSEEQVGRLRELLGTQDNETAFLKAMGPGLDRLGGFYYDRFGKALELVAEFMARQAPGKPTEPFQVQGSPTLRPKPQGAPVSDYAAELGYDQDTGEVTAPPRPTRPRPPRPGDTPDFATANIRDILQWMASRFNTANDEDEANHIWDTEILYRLKQIPHPANQDTVFGAWQQLMTQFKG